MTINVSVNPSTSPAIIHLLIATKLLSHPKQNVYCCSGYSVSAVVIIVIAVTVIGHNFCLMISCLQFVNFPTMPILHPSFEPSELYNFTPLR